MSSERCMHPVVLYGDLCASCGHKLDGREMKERDAGSKLMIVGGKQVLYGKKQANLMAQQAIRRLNSKGMLALVLDIDHTMLHATRDSRASNFKGVYTLSRQGYVKFRPGLINILNHLSSMYELSVYTHGTRIYAADVVKLIENVAKSRNGGKISWRFQNYVARDDFSADQRKGTMTKAKDLEDVVSCNPVKVLVLDDKPEVWVQSQNVIPCLPFFFFKGLKELYDRNTGVFGSGKSGHKMPKDRKTRAGKRNVIPNPRVPNALNKPKAKKTTFDPRSGNTQAQTLRPKPSGQLGDWVKANSVNREIVSNPAKSSAYVPPPPGPSKSYKYSPPPRPTSSKNMLSVRPKKSSELMPPPKSKVKINFHEIQNRKRKRYLQQNGSSSTSSSSQVASNTSNVEGQVEDNVLQSLVAVLETVHALHYFHERKLQPQIKTDLAASEKLTKIPMHVLAAKSGNSISESKFAAGLFPRKKRNEQSSSLSLKAKKRNRSLPSRKRTRMMIPRKTDALPDTKKDLEVETKNDSSENSSVHTSSTQPALVSIDPERALQVRKSLRGRPVSDILWYLRHSILSGVRCVFSGVVPRGTQVSAVKEWKLASQLGAICFETFTERGIGSGYQSSMDKKYDKITHVIAARDGSEKVSNARKLGIFVVHVAWLNSAASHFFKPPESEFPVQGAAGMPHSKIFHANDQPTPERLFAALCKAELQFPGPNDDAKMMKPKKEGIFVNKEPIQPSENRIDLTSDTSHKSSRVNSQMPDKDVRRKDSTKEASDDDMILDDAAIEEMALEFGRELS